MLYYYKKLKNYFLFIICLFLLFVSLIKVKASPNYIDEIYKQRRIIEENKVKNEETNKESVKKEEIVVKQESFIDEIYRKQRKDCEIETSKLQEIFDYLPCLDIVLEQNKDKYEESEIRKEFNRLYKEINKNSLNQENAIETIYKQLRKKFEKKKIIF
ncbi:hypothetical protein CPX_001731 [Candidatus Phytoplasma pruni]|uniref:Uncharacterized protein n=1 Tax=Candidatus Phytoplasma pruni TaxID=479893 RepID=A0A0M1N000_9MOLU|nr:hypothetical protein [Candidatus Phytoplasma pruni]KOR75299.1 hypothetical protein CPX_001731 [Candidatus Phytoplasma pruni]